MKYSAFKGLTYLVIISLFAFDVGAVGLQEYLQNTGEAETLTQITPPLITIANEVSNQLIHIIELVVAGIVASALIITVLVIFLGRRLAGKEKKIIKKLRIEAEQDKNNITSATVTIREQEKETTKLTHTMRNQAIELSTQQKVTEKYNQEIINTSEKIKSYEQDITSISANVSESMSKIQSYWNSQLHDTVSTINQFQDNLGENLGIVDEGLEKMSQQKTLSKKLLQELLDKHNEQSNILENNSEMSQKITQNLEQAYDESDNLIELLQQHQKSAESSLNNYVNKLNHYEEQAYEQFDTSFQVADLARQELTTNLEENRKHIETMRRQEEQSHGISSQTMKNLEVLDYSKIVKISNTLDTTQNMFDEIHHKVEETRHMLEELKEIESDVRQTASNVESAVKDQSNAKEVEEDNSSEDLKSEENKTSGILETVNQNNTTIAITDYKMASGDSTPLSFFKDIKQNKK